MPTPPRDHLIVSAAPGGLAVGDEQRFQIGYSSLLRAMTSPFVARCFVKSLRKSRTRKYEQSAQN